MQKLNSSQKLALIIPSKNNPFIILKRSQHRSCAREVSLLKMKFSVAASLLALGTVSGFVTPQNAFARSVSHSMADTATEVYTFAKSEEIFAEAQTVRHKGPSFLSCSFFAVREINVSP